MNAVEIINNIVEIVRQSLRSNTVVSITPNNNGSSFYLKHSRGNNQKPVQIRLSNHGTFLRTWVDRANLQDSKIRLYDPSMCINISIVFVDDNNSLTDKCGGQKDCTDCTILPCVPKTFDGQDELGRPFTVHQYVYRSNLIRNRNIKGLVRAILEAAKNGEFKDPLVNTERRSIPKELNSAQNLKEHTIYKYNNELNKNNTMKQTIRLTETDIHNMIIEALNEYEDWKPEVLAAQKAEKEVPYSGHKHLNHANQLIVKKFPNRRYDYYKDNGTDKKPKSIASGEFIPSVGINHGELIANRYPKELEFNTYPDGTYPYHYYPYHAKRISKYGASGDDEGRIQPKPTPDSNLVTSRYDYDKLFGLRLPNKQQEYDWDAASQDMKDFYSGAYKERMRKKASQLPNAKSGQDFIPDTLKESVTKAIRKYLH